MNEKINDADDRQMLAVRVARIDIADLDLSVRAYVCLTRYGVNYLGQLANLTRRELSQIRYLSAKSMYEIEKKLENFNIHLRDE